MQWPFKSMSVGESVVIWDLPPQKVAATAHTVGRYKGWNFKTKTVSINGRSGVRVTRIPGPNDTPDVAVPSNNRERPIPLYGYEYLEVGESITLTGEHETLGKAVNGVPARERRFKAKFKRACKVDERCLYKEVTITRVA